jgi:guanine deaminase
MQLHQPQYYRASILHFTDIPDPHTQQGIDYYEDGVLTIKNGLVNNVASADAMASQGFDLTQCQYYPRHLIMPGFIDSHIHFPQTQIIASYGEQLLDWLTQYTFPAEMKFSNAEFCAEAAEIFLNLLLENGTTSAMVYTSVFAQSTEEFFNAARHKNMRMIAGKVMMDRNAPNNLLDTPAGSERDSRQLIERWHQQHRLSYALTPRFAPTCSPEQLQLIGKLLIDYPDVYLQTHLSENIHEINWVKNLFPHAKSYLDVYDQAGLLGSRSIFGHGIHLSDNELKRLAETNSTIAFCPSSNLFLGSGLLDIERMDAANVSWSIATDVGAGTSFSLLKTLADAYKVLQLQQQSLHPLQGFYRATLGNARCLQLDHKIGNFAVGKEADFIVIDLAVSPIQKIRQAESRNLTDTLFALMMLGDEMNIAYTYIMGKLKFSRNNLQDAKN